MAKQKHLYKKKKIILITTSIALALIILFIVGYFIFNKANNIRIIYITDGYAPHSEELIGTIQKDTKNYSVKGITIKEFKPDSIIIERDGETKEFKYNEEIGVSGYTGCSLEPHGLCVDAPVHYIRFEK